MEEIHCLPLASRHDTPNEEGMGLVHLACYGTERDGTCAAPVGHEKAFEGLTFRNKDTFLPRGHAQAECWAAALDLKAGWRPGPGGGQQSQVFQGRQPAS